MMFKGKARDKTMLITDYYGEITPGSREEPERKYTSVTKTLPNFLSLFYMFPILSSKLASL